MIVKRILYLAYYLKNLNRSLFFKFLNFGSKKSAKMRLLLILDTVYSSLRYNISLLEYFQFGFYALPHRERLKWAGTGYMYEYQRLMNPVKERIILSDKIIFCQYYQKFIQRNVFCIADLKNNEENIDQILNNSTRKLVFKAKSGNSGKQVEIRNTSDFKADTVLDYMNCNGFDMVEDFIVQHHMLSKLSPNSVNTVRIFTNLNNKNKVDLLGCRLRLGITKNVDNLASGGIAAAIDEESGIVDTAGFYSDFTKSPELNHPVSGMAIMGYQIPYWNEIIQMVKEAAMLHPQNRSIGWDIAITENGPELIEGNHDWCKLVYQLPVQKGLKAVLDKYRLGES